MSTVSDALNAKPDTLLVFIDETGNEDFSDPKNPTFGRGGCATSAGEYQRVIKKPWRKLKRQHLGGASKPFHGTDFERAGPTMAQISAINRFLRSKFWRFAVMSDGRTLLPPGVDGHKAVSLVTIKFISRLAAMHDTAEIALIFEASGRGDELVKRDFELARMQFLNRSGVPIEIGGYFIEKRQMEAGLEVADLIAHTAGRQRRHQMAGRQGVTKDFEQMYWHSPIPPAFMAIDSVQLSELSIKGEADREG